MIGEPKRHFKGRTLAKIGAVLGAIILAILIMAFVPWELTMAGSGSLLPEERRITFAPTAGIVEEVLVEHGQHVKKGDLLVRLESKDLDKDLEKLRAERDSAASQIATLKSKRSKPTTKPEEYLELLGQLREAEVRLDGAEKQIELIEEQKKLMLVSAPQDGIVTTWESKRNLLQRPVEVGAELISIALTEGEWVLEVEVPDGDMGPILAAKSKLDAEIAEAKKKGVQPKRTALEAYFVTMTDPEHRYEGKVRKISSHAETIDGKHVDKVTVGFDEKVRREFRKNNKDFRPGSEVRARVRCGHARLAYVLLRDVLNVFHEVVLFRWPFITK